MPSPASDTPTGTSAPAVSSQPPSVRPLLDEGRFIAGTVFPNRYRIVNLLGRGGMGEVYRATDLMLRQTVAVKFLPELSARNEQARARLQNEVRMAREITHPNVCRLHDIGEDAGEMFVSMEYVDGEDLASLLARIGRLPPDKATEVAGGICAGLAAAHRRGVLHRDLKPANVEVQHRQECACARCVPVLLSAAPLEC